MKINKWAFIMALTASSAIGCGGGQSENTNTYKPEATPDHTDNYRVVTTDKDNTRLSERIIWTGKANQDTIIKVLRDRYFANRYNTDGKKVFIYIYPHNTSESNLSDNWIGMVSDYGVDVKYTVNPADPTTEIKHLGLQ